MLQTQQIASFKNIFPGKHAAERPQNILLNVINHAPGYASRRKQLHSMQLSQSPKSWAPLGKSYIYSHGLYLFEEMRS